MNVEIKSTKRKVVISIVLVCAVVLSLMFFVYGMTQQMVAQKLEETNVQLVKEKQELLKQNQELVKQLEKINNKIELARRLSQENLESSLKLKKK